MFGRGGATDFQQDLAEPYKKDRAGRYDKLDKAFTGTGAALMALAGRKSRLAAVAGGALASRGRRRSAGPSLRPVSSPPATPNTRSCRSANGYANGYANGQPVARTLAGGAALDAVARGAFDVALTFHVPTPGA